MADVAHEQLRTIEIILDGLVVLMPTVPIAIGCWLWILAKRDLNEYLRRIVKPKYLIPYGAVWLCCLVGLYFVRGRLNEEVSQISFLF
jgi:hypothetical protein